VLQLGSTDTEKMEAKTVEQVLEQARVAPRRGLSALRPRLDQAAADR
jgi:hypothetical protein